MNSRERYLSMLSFRPVDNGFSWELGFWEQTIARWIREGLPEDVHLGGAVHEVGMFGCEYFGLDRIVLLPLKIMEMIPPFVEEILEEDERYRVKRFANGIVTRALKEGELHPNGQRMSMDQYIGFPVTDRESWLNVKRRYNPSSPVRYPPWWEDAKRCMTGRDYPLLLTPNGSFGLYS